MAECARFERGAQAIQSKRMQLLRARRREMSAGVHGRGMGERQVQWSEKLTIDVGRIHARSMARLAAARIELDRYYWGVWGSARRCKASTREVQALMVALREAEHGDWYGDLPGGSTWWDAAAAAMENAGQLGGECALHTLMLEELPAPLVALLLRCCTGVSCNGCPWCSKFIIYNFTGFY